MDDADNHLLNTIAQNQGPPWLGEILIVKCNKDGVPIDMNDDDLPLVPIVLKRYSHIACLCIQD